MRGVDGVYEVQYEDRWHPARLTNLNPDHTVDAELCLQTPQTPGLNLTSHSDDELPKVEFVRGSCDELLDVFHLHNVDRSKVRELVCRGWSSANGGRLAPKRCVWERSRRSTSIRPGG